MILNLVVVTSIPEIWSISVKSEWRDNTNTAYYCNIWLIDVYSYLVLSLIDPFVSSPWSQRHPYLYTIARNSHSWRPQL